MQEQAAPNLAGDLNEEELRRQLSMLSDPYAAMLRSSYWLRGDGSATGDELFEVTLNEVATHYRAVVYSRVRR